MEWMLYAGGTLAAIIIIFLLDSLATWMESNGWIYWRKSKGASSRLGNAFLEMQSMFEPGKKHVIEAKQEVKRKKTAAGGPPTPKK